MPHARTICYIEREAYCCVTLLARMRDGILDEAPIWDDLRTFDGQPWHGLVDCIHGGPPCQPVSLAGKHQVDSDARWLWDVVEELVWMVRPRIVFFENVAGLAAGKWQAGLSAIFAGLEKLGYQMAADLFTALEVGAPHRRKRLFLMGVRRSSLRAAGLPGKIMARKPGRQPLLYPPGPLERSAWVEYRRRRPEMIPALPQDIPAGRSKSRSGVLETHCERIRACGNAVMPAMAHLAWRTLSDALDVVV